MMILSAASAVLCATLAVAQATSSPFVIEEASIFKIQNAFASGALTSAQLVQYYINKASDPKYRALNSILEINPDALALAQAADSVRANCQKQGAYCNLGPLHGIPILLKDNIGTGDKLNTTAASYALLGSKTQDSFIASQLRKSGAIIYGKAAMSEWAGWRSMAPDFNGWNPRGGHVINPYVTDATPCGSSAGSAVATTSNLITVSLGTETDGSIICPSAVNGLVGLKPTVGLTSRTGVVPLSHHQDSVGPIARSVADIAAVMDAIVETDPSDPASKGTQGRKPVSYTLSLIYGTRGLGGARIGVVDNTFDPVGDAFEYDVGQQTISVLTNLGAFVKHVNTSNIDLSFEFENLATDFKMDLNQYLTTITNSPIKNIDDLVQFTQNNPLEQIKTYDQELLLKSQNKTGYSDPVYISGENSRQLAKQQIINLFTQNGLDVLYSAGVSTSFISIAATLGLPIITVPVTTSNLYLTTMFTSAKLSQKAFPIGISLIGLPYSEGKLIQYAYAIEQQTKARFQPGFVSEVGAPYP
ncbi:putative amidase [Polychytrium aggregatum]|uniref:putative amidase n=1 Tax=Polychytrium aggregatum TaxID=110093 RepID=UPI0022FE3072|nr:putative amidase [Polychytrium aggregatum]KAI9192938.1 putative amidase [Polychytrium aggregatum]